MYAPLQEEAAVAEETQADPVLTLAVLKRCLNAFAWARYLRNVPDFGTIAMDEPMLLRAATPTSHFAKVSPYSEDCVWINSQYNAAFKIGLQPLTGNSCLKKMEKGTFIVATLVSSRDAVVGPYLMDNPEPGRFVSPIFDCQALDDEFWSWDGGSDGRVRAIFWHVRATSPEEAVEILRPFCMVGSHAGEWRGMMAAPSSPEVVPFEKTVSALLGKASITICLML